MLFGNWTVLFLKCRNKVVSVGFQFRWQLFFKIRWHLSICNKLTAKKINFASIFEQPEPISLVSPLAKIVKRYYRSSVARLEGWTLKAAAAKVVKRVSHLQGVNQNQRRPNSLKPRLLLPTKISAQCRYHFQHWN